MVNWAPEVTPLDRGTACDITRNLQTSNADLLRELMRMSAKVAGLADRHDLYHAQLTELEALYKDIAQIVREADARLTCLNEMMTKALRDSLEADE